MSATDVVVSESAAGTNGRKKHRLVGGMHEFDPSCIVPCPFQPRVWFDPRELQLLADSIKKDGQQTPAVVTPYYGGIPPPGVTHMIVDGERRWRACLMAGCNYSANCITVQDAKKHYKRSVISNFHQSNHTNGETALAVKSFREDYGMTWAEVATSLCMEEVTAQKYYNLTHLHPDIFKLLDPPTSRKERITTLLAAELSHLPPEEQLAVLAKVRGKEAATATQAIRLAVAAAEQRGGQVRKAARGRARTPSDDVQIIERKLKRALVLINHVEEIELTHLKQILGRRDPANNKQLIQMFVTLTKATAAAKGKIIGVLPPSHVAKT